MAKTEKKEVKEKKWYRVVDHKVQVLGWRYGTSQQVWVNTDLIEVTKPQRIPCAILITKDVRVGEIEGLEALVLLRNGKPIEPKLVKRYLDVAIVYHGEGTIRVDAETKLVVADGPPEWLGRSKVEATLIAVRERMEYEKNFAAQHIASRTKEVERALQSYKDLERHNTEEIGRVARNLNKYTGALERMEKSLVAAGVGK